MIDTNITYTQKDEGKNLYRKTTYYNLMITQEVLAKDKDEADKLLNDCGIDHSAVNDKLTETKNGVETLFVDADYQSTSDTDYIGKVVYDTDNYGEEAIIDGYVKIDGYADENALSAKEESDVDTSINLEWERKLGK